MAYLMIGYDLALLLAHDAVFLFFPHKHLFHRIKQILLSHIFSAVLYRIDCRLIDHVGQIRSHRAAGSKGNCIQIHTLVQMDVLGMYFQDLYPSLQVRFIHNNPSVKTARTKERFIQYLRTVGCSQHQNPLGGIKTIHLRQKLV